MSVLYDAIVAFLCCAGIIVTFMALFLPKSSSNTKIAGVVISENSEEIVKKAVALKTVFSEVIVVTRLDLNGILPEDIEVISPEEFEIYATGND